jgi:transcriptional regulator
MYVPIAFAEERVDVLHDFIRRHGFASLVTCGRAGPTASHVPVVLVPEQGNLGALHFHLAKPNEQCTDLMEGSAALLMFHGPHAYISPGWYAKPEAAVPTWNYIVVHAHGAARVMSDDRLAYHLRMLVSAYESTGSDGWSVKRLTGEAFEKLRRGIVGFEVEIIRLQGKWKLGQNRSREDREGAVRGLRKSMQPESLAVADLMAATLESDAKPPAA